MGLPCYEISNDILHTFLTLGMILHYLPKVCTSDLGMLLSLPKVVLLPCGEVVEWQVGLHFAEYVAY